MGIEGEFGYVKCKVVPTDLDQKDIDETDKSNQIKRPMDLISRGLCANFRLRIKTVVVYEVKKVLNKDAYLEIVLRENDKEKIIKSELFRFEDCEKKLKWNFYMILDKITENTIDFYINKKLRINLFVDDNRIIEPMEERSSLRLLQQKSLMSSTIKTEKDVQNGEKRCFVF